MHLWTVLITVKLWLTVPGESGVGQRVLLPKHDLEGLRPEMETSLLWVGHYLEALSPYVIYCTKVVYMDAYRIARLY